MKKSLIALAVAGAMTAPIVAQADATLYGSLRVALTNTDMGGSNDDWQVADETSRIGIKGDVDLGMENATGYYHFETRLKADNGEFAGGETMARISLVGLKGNWGAVQAGRMWTPHWLFVTSTATAHFNNSSIGEIRSVGTRQGNTIAYITPDMNGFQAAGAVIMGGVTNWALKQGVAGTGTLGGDNNDKNADGYNVAAKYTGGGLHAGISYMSVDSLADGTDPDYDALGVAASYDLSGLKFFGRYQTEELGNTFELDTYQLGASYTMGDTVMVARWSDLDLETPAAANDADGNQWAVGVTHMLGKRGRVWVEYADADSDLNALSAVNFTGDPNDPLNLHGVGAGDIISIGYRLDF